MILKAMLDAAAFAAFLATAVGAAYAAIELAKMVVRKWKKSYTPD